MSYKPVSYNPKKTLEKDLQNQEFKQELEALEDDLQPWMPCLQHVDRQE